MRKLFVAMALAGCVGALGALPAFSDTSGGVSATVSVASPA